ncbi:MAG: LCP family protein [Lachnospiraceae bacterium]
MEQHKNKQHKSKNNHIAGKLIAVLQLLVSVIFAAVLWNSGMIPGIYLAVLIVLLLVLFVITFDLQYLKPKAAHGIGILISILLIVILGIGTVYLMKTTSMMKTVGGATYKTDNMVVVVKTDNAAQSLKDAKNYRFGSQTSVDQENNQLMIKDIESSVGREINLQEYDTVVEEAEALLAGKVEAAIYNEAFTGIIEESIEDYSDQVRILYQYGIDTEIEQEETNIEEPFNVYISGIDVSGPITTNSRSDVNIIMTVNPNTKQILLTTTPRDYYVTIPNISGESRDKLTHAGIYGVDASMATLENIYGIDISYYARVNFTSLIKIVDALGGVDVNSEYAFTTTHGKYQIQQGINHMDGETALGFSRERYSFEDGDNQRGKNQEAVLTAILKKAMSPAILMNASQIIDTVGDSVETNMTQDEMAKFINMQLSDGADWTIESQAATGTGDNQACFSSGSQLLYVMWPDEAVDAALSEKMQQVLTGK